MIKTGWKDVPCSKCKENRIFGSSFSDYPNQLVPLVVEDKMCDKCKLKIELITNIVKDLYVNFNDTQSIMFKVLEDKKSISFKTGPNGKYIIKVMSD